MKWKKLSKLIPSRVQITKDTWYEILWADEIKEGDHICGVMRPSEKQIVILKNMSPKTTFVTFIHELCHAFSDENDVSLTETQILKLEKTFYYWLKIIKQFT